jgi:hypothetical protein
MSSTETIGILSDFAVAVADGGAEVFAALALEGVGLASLPHAAVAHAIDRTASSLERAARAAKRPGLMGRRV